VYSLVGTVGKAMSNYNRWWLIMSRVKQVLHSWNPSLCFFDKEKGAKVYFKVEK
jgi:hypothetical protein